MMGDYLCHFPNNAIDIYLKIDFRYNKNLLYGI